MDVLITKSSCISWRNMQLWNVENDSGKHNGKSQISHRERKHLRYVLYEAAILLIGKNEEFKAIHEYYIHLRKMRSIVAVACKILRVFYTTLTKGVDYDAGKLMGNIRRIQSQGA